VSTLAQHLQTRVPLERETAGLLARIADMPASVVTTLVSEVDRRERLFADLRAASPRTGEHPRLAALRSVTADVQAGRFA